VNEVAHLIDSISREPYVLIRAPKSCAELQTPHAIFVCLFCWLEGIVTVGGNVYIMKGLEKK
jgi:hypothetical protein